MCGVRREQFISSGNCAVFAQSELHYSIIGNLSFSLYIVFMEFFRAEGGEPGRDESPQRGLFAQLNWNLTLFTVQ